MRQILVTRQTRCPFPGQRPSRASLAQSAPSRPHPAGPTGLTPTHRTALLLAGAKGVRGWFAGTVFRVKDGDGAGVRWVAGDERGRAALSLLSRDRNFMAGKATKAAPAARWDGRDNVVDSHCNEQSEGTAGRQAALIMPFSRMPTVSTSFAAPPAPRVSSLLSLSISLSISP